MRRTLRRTLVLTLLLALAVALLPIGAVGAEPGGAEPGRFVASLSGGEEVPPADTRARGQTILRLIEHDGAPAIEYKLLVANIENVTQAHIHLAPVGVNGPVVAWLYPEGPPAQLIPGRTNGQLSMGTITAADLVGQLAGQPLDTLLEHMRAGNTYVNVHTSQFPPGEVRGQIRGR